MTREEAINEIKSWDFLKGKEIEAIHTLIPELRESEDERIRQKLMWLLQQDICPFPEEEVTQMVAYLEKQKESLHVQETCKENADSFTSEDERIRKEIIDFLETIPASELKRIPRPINEWFAWLEKQKEYHIPWYDYQKSKEAGYTIVPNEEYDRLTKPAEWSEEDKKVYSRLLNHYESLTHCVTTADRHQEIREELNFLKSLRPQPKQEWSEEDEMYLSQAIETLEHENYSILADKLKSLRPVKQEWSEEDEKMRNLAIEWAETMDGQFRFVDMGSTDFRKIVAWLKDLRPSWKPSEEQMEALEIIVRYGDKESTHIKNLTSLYEQLKKL